MEWVRRVDQAERLWGRFGRNPPSRKATAARHHRKAPFGSVPENEGSCGGKVEVFGDPDGRFGEWGAVGCAMLDFIPDDGAEVGVAGFL